MDCQPFGKTWLERDPNHRSPAPEPGLCLRKSVIKINNIASSCYAVVTIYKVAAKMKSANRKASLLGEILV